MTPTTIAPAPGPQAMQPAPQPLRRRARGGAALLPGLLLCVAVTLAALLLERVEARLLGRAWLEALVLAILVGTAVRTAWTPGARWSRGIGFGAKTLLEVAVVLLGASVSAATVLAAGPGLLVGIAVVVVIAIGCSYGMGRLLGLPHRMATLIACGNSICGNSAIAAVAPVIGADGEDIAASIAFTAVLGVAVVLLLPLTVPLLHLSGLQYGALAGLTVYAVPQVLAATAPVGAVAVQLGTLVKLVRVLMLGPVVLGLSLLTRRLREEADEPAPHVTAGDRPAPGQLDPPRRASPRLAPTSPGPTSPGPASAGAVVHPGLPRPGGAALARPRAAARPGACGWVANLLTVISMAALGLGTDLRVVVRAGGRVTAAVTLSLLLLATISLGLIRLLGLA